ncbi:MAG: MBL fold metallo-hydrolase [SAR324 cluster bacterium]|nr:MBL fold metallo-hydrolase [SAR324 cluster bacterium]
MKRTIRWCWLLGLVAMLGVTAMLGLPAALSAQDDAVREITPIADGLYRFRNNFHYSMFLVTSEGIVATDPINADAARWLKAELDRRFGQPVRYLIYSHSHGDHISGGEVFADTAIVVAHENAKAEILANNVPTAPPDLVFSDRMTLTLGGKTVELSYLGKSHSDNLIVMRFVDSRVVFGVDFVSAKRMPYRDFPGGFLDDWPHALEALEARDFDILATGHGPMGGPSDVREARGYLEELRAAVAARIEQGMSDAQIVEAVTMDKYRNWGRYEDWRALNVQGMTRHLRQSR